MSDASQQTPETEQETEGMKNLREAEKRANARAEAMAKENAFLKAGVNPEGDARLQFFYENYQGELTGEAVRAKAQELGFIEAETPSTPEPGTSQDPEQTKVRETMASDTLEPQGAQPERARTVETDYEMYRDDLKEGALRPEAAGAVFGGIFERARSGDPNAVYDAHAWRESEAAKSR